MTAPVRSFVRYKHVINHLLCHIHVHRWYFKALYESRIPLIDGNNNKGRAAAAIQSLADTAYSDELVLAKWCVNFLKYPSLPQAATAAASSSSFASSNASSAQPIQARV
jgi:hypothetical protein